MKRKILALGLFSLCCLTSFTADANAFFGLLSPYHPSSLWHRHNRYVTQITCRPYNAFTPICWGNLVCDGCNPSPCGVASGCLPMTMGVPPWANSGCCGMPCMGGGYAMGGACGHDYSHASDMPMMGGPPMHMQPMPDIRSQPYMPPTPDIRSQPFTPPMPTPMPMPMGPNISMYPQSGVAQANYYPMYMPQYPNYFTPTYYNPYQGWSQPAPYYWYGSGR